MDRILKLIFLALLIPLLFVGLVMALLVMCAYLFFSVREWLTTRKRRQRQKCEPDAEETASILPDVVVQHERIIMIGVAHTHADRGGGEEAGGDAPASEPQIESYLSFRPALIEHGKASRLAFTGDESTALYLVFERSLREVAELRESWAGSAEADK